MLLRDVKKGVGVRIIDKMTEFEKTNLQMFQFVVQFMGGA